MEMDERLRLVTRRQLGLLEALHRARREIVDIRGRTRMRIAELKEHERQAAAHYEQAVEEADPDAEALRELPRQAQRRAEELEAAVAELDAAEKKLADHIARTTLEIEDFELLAPLLVARIAAARTAGLGREVFETLNDALRYIEFALDKA